MSATDISSDQANYRLDEQWPHYPADMTFEMGSGVCVDDEDTVYLFTRDIEHWAAHPLAMKDKMGKSSVSMFRRDGTYLGSWGPSQEPGFALGAHTIYFIDGFIWTVDRDGHMVKKYTKDGELVLALGELGQWGKDPGHFNGPTSVVVQPNGNVVVSDGYWNARLIWFSPDGEYIKEIGGWGNEPGQFNSPHAVAQMPDGRLVVVDFRGGALHDYMTVKGQIADERWEQDPSRKSRIQVFDPDGEFIEQWDHLNPLTVAVYGDRLYASDNMSDLVVYDAHTMQELERHEKLAIYIHQMAVDSFGDIYTATVYPEHAGEPRGPHGPCNRRWTKAPA